MASEPLLKRECATVYRQEGNRVPCFNTGGFDVYSMNKTGDRRKMLISRANEKVDSGAALVPPH
jgi:hypothetical protein